jgi:hypothetical protein
MINVEVKVNYNTDEDLYCAECKNKIYPFEKYLVVVEDYFGETLRSPIHLDCICETDEE